MLGGKLIFYEKNPPNTFIAKHIFVVKQVTKFYILELMFLLMGYTLIMGVIL